MSRQQSRFGRWKLATSVLAAIPLCMYSAVSAAATEAPAVFGIPVDFILFALTLLGVALFHRHTFYVALTGRAVITLY